MQCDLSLYLVTDATLCADAGLEATVEAAVKGGFSPPPGEWVPTDGELRWLLGDGSRASPRL